MIWLTLLPVSIAFNLLAILLAPLLPLFAVPRAGWTNNHEKQAVEPRLPDWLAWFATFDNSLLGDDGHKERWKEGSTYWQMVAWLLRNPAYGFEWSVLAVEPKGEIRCAGNPWIKNRDNAVAGWYFARCDNAWNFRAVWHLYGDTAFMPEFGWRLGPWAQGRGSGLAMYVFSIRLTAVYL